MDSSVDQTVFVMDQTPAASHLLEEMIRSWGLKARSISYACSPLAQIEENNFDVLLLDVNILESLGDGFVTKFGKECSDARVITMGESIRNQTVVSALRAGAFAFVNKPIHEGIARHAIQRALEDLAKERQLLRIEKELQKLRIEILNRQKLLDLLNSQLIDTNKALSVLVQNMEHERNQLEIRIAARLQSLLVPSIQRLQNIKSLEPYKADLDMMLYELEDLSSTFSSDSIIASILSPCELRIASLIKHGVTTEAIARQLHVSPATVRTHRKNIRRKLKLNGTSHSLRSYLQLPPENKESDSSRLESMLKGKNLHHQQDKPGS